MKITPVTRTNSIRIVSKNGGHGIEAELLAKMRPRPIIWTYAVFVPQWLDTATQINQLEMIQRRAARYVLDRHHDTSSVTNMLQTLEWRSLSDRRNDAKLCMIYKIANCLVGIPANKYLIPVNTVSRKLHSLCYLIPHSRCNYHLYSFFPSTIWLWNSLRQHGVNKNSLDAFKGNIQTLHYSTF